MCVPPRRALVRELLRVRPQAEPRLPREPREALAGGVEDACVCASSPAPPAIVSNIPRAILFPARRAADPRRRLRLVSAEFPRRGRGGAATHVHASRSLHHPSRGCFFRRVARPRSRRRDSSPRNLHVADAAVPRRVSRRRRRAALVAQALVQPPALLVRHAERPLGALALGAYEIGRRTTAHAVALDACGDARSGGGVWWRRCWVGCVV